MPTPTPPRRRRPARPPPRPPPHPRRPPPRPPPPPPTRLPRRSWRRRAAAAAVALRAVREDNAALMLQTQVLCSEHARFVERLLIEQAEAWRANEITPAECAESVVNGLQACIGTIGHAAPSSKAHTATAGAFHALLDLCDARASRGAAHCCREVLRAMSAPGRTADASLLRQALLHCPVDAIARDTALLLLHAVRGASVGTASQSAEGALASRDFFAALLGVLPHVAAQFRRTPSYGRHYLSLLQAIGTEHGAALRAAAPPSSRRLLRLFVDFDDDMDGLPPPVASPSAARPLFTDTGSGVGPPPITRGGGGSALGASSAAYGVTSYGTSLYNRTADHYDPQSPNRGYDSHLYSTSRDDSPGAGRAGLGYLRSATPTSRPGAPARRRRRRRRWRRERRLL